jgi:hypothetical protein
MAAAAHNWSHGGPSHAPRGGALVRVPAHRLHGAALEAAGAAAREQLSDQQQLAIFHEVVGEMIKDEGDDDKKTWMKDTMASLLILPPRISNIFQQISHRQSRNDQIRGYILRKWLDYKNDLDESLGVS